MQSKSKPRVIKDFEKLDKNLQEQVMQMYPAGFVDNLISYTDPKTGQERFALPYETEDRYYMIRMDEYIDSQIDNDSEEDDFSKDLLDLGLDKMDKPADIKLDEDEDDDDIDEDEDTNKNSDEDGDDDDDDDDIENIADEDSEEEEEENE